MTKGLSVDIRSVVLCCLIEEIDVTILALEKLDSASPLTASRLASHTVDQAFLDSEPGQFRDRVCAELGNEPASMKFHRLHGNLQNLGNFLVLPPFGNQLEDLPLPIRQLQRRALSN